MLMPQPSEPVPLSDKQRWASQGLDAETSLARPDIKRQSSHPDLLSPTPKETEAGFGFPPATPVESAPAPIEPRKVHFHLQSLIIQTFGGSLRELLSRSLHSIFGSRNLDEPRIVKVCLPHAYMTCRARSMSRRRRRRSHKK